MPAHVCAWARRVVRSCTLHRALASPIPVAGGEARPRAAWGGGIGANGEDFLVEEEFPLQIEKDPQTSSRSRLPSPGRCWPLGRQRVLRLHLGAGKLNRVLGQLTMQESCRSVGR